MMRDILLETLERKDSLIFDLNYRRIDQITRHCYSINYFSDKLVMYHYVNHFLKEKRVFLTKHIHYNLSKLSEIF